MIQPFWCYHKFAAQPRHPLQLSVLRAQWHQGQGRVLEIPWNRSWLLWQSLHLIPSWWCFKTFTFGCSADVLFLGQSFTAAFRATELSNYLQQLCRLCCLRWFFSAWEMEASRAVFSNVRPTHLSKHLQHRLQAGSHQPQIASDSLSLWLQQIPRQCCPSSWLELCQDLQKHAGKPSRSGSFLRCVFFAKAWKSFGRILRGGAMIKAGLDQKPCHSSKNGQAWARSFSHQRCAVSLAINSATWITE